MITQKLKNGITECIFLICILLPTILPIQTGWTELSVWFLLFLAFSCIICSIGAIFTQPFKVGVVDILMFVWWAYILLRTYFSPAIPCCKEIVTYTSMLVLYFIIRLVDIGMFSEGKWINTIFLCFVAYELLLGFDQICTRNNLQNQWLTTGSFFNPGPYSAYITMGVVMAIYLLHNTPTQIRAKRGTDFYISIMIVIGGAIIIPVTRSRAALITIFCLFLFLYKNKLRKHWISLSLVGMIILMGLFYIKYESAMGRIVLWRLTSSIWYTHCFFGAGIASFPYEYGKQLETFFSNEINVLNFAKYADVTEFAFNDMLQLLAEQGSIGGIFCCAVIGLSLKGLYSQANKLPFFGFCALLVFSLSSYPFQLLPFQILATIFMAMGARAYSKTKISYKYTIIAMILLSCISYGCYKTASKRFSANQDYKKSAGRWHETFIQTYYNIEPFCHDNIFFLYDFAIILQKQQRYLDSNAILRKAVLISCDPILWVIMGNNYKSMSLYDEALYCYNRAFRRMPNRIYPLYQKMLLLEENNKINEMLYIAKSIVLFKPKIPSSAVEKMKERAKSLIKKQKYKKIAQQTNRN